MGNHSVDSPIGRRFLIRGGKIGRLKIIENKENIDRVHQKSMKNDDKANNL
jgi:hypothetical protein